jgi:hypothetical protein
MNTRILSRVKRPGCDVDHSSPSSTEVTNKWSYAFTALLCLDGIDRDNFAFLCIHVRNLKAKGLNGQIKANSHIPCRSHAAPMPLPCYAVPLKV